MQCTSPISAVLHYEVMALRQHRHVDTVARTHLHSIARLLARFLELTLTHLPARIGLNSLSHELSCLVPPNYSVFTVFLHAIPQINPAVKIF